MPKITNITYGLPAKSYTDQQFWEIECNTVLSNGWLFVGFAHELKKPGDVNPLFIANKPILLLRNNNKGCLLDGLFYFVMYLIRES